MSSSMHFYTTSTTEPATGYTAEGITAYVLPQQKENAVAFYRWRHPESNLHFYTVDPAGEAAPVLGYVMEKIECYVPAPGTLNSVPLYRWYNAESGDHLYTLDPNGELGPSSGYVAEGIACYVFPAGVAGTVPLYRWVAGDQIYCIMLSRQGKVVFSKNYNVATYEQALVIAQAALSEYNTIQTNNGMPTADKAEPPKLGGC